MPDTLKFWSQAMPLLPYLQSCLEIFICNLAGAVPLLSQYQDKKQYQDMIC